MLTQVEKNLIRLLKSVGLDRETTVNISILARTDENRMKMINAILDRYQEKGKVTEQEIQRIGLMITSERKNINEG